MDVSIDRRLRRDLFWFMLQDPEFYEEPSIAPSASQQCKQMLAAYLPSDWTVVKQGIWLHAMPSHAALPLQGFKIHISGTSVTAEELIHRVVPICVGNQATFKIMGDPFMIEMTTCKNYSRGASGKFITIYPDDNAHFVKLAEALDKATTGMAGPYILSDRRYADSKVVFYRYGGFAPRFTLNTYGEKVPMMHTADGTLVPDIRYPFFQLPEGVLDPFESEVPQNAGQVLLKDRYVVREAIIYSNAGGVYKAEDQRTGQTVIIKEARPFINVTRHDGDLDAIATLKKEANVLEKLEHTGYTPRLIDFFQEWEHFFLVEEFVDGIQLSSYRALPDVALVLQRLPTDEDVKRFCTRLYRIAANLICALQAFHREGVIMGDLSPYNILVNPETLDLKIIDFEAAYVPGESQTAEPLALFTPGFVSPSRRAGADLSQQDDFYSLSSVIYSLISPVQEFFQLSPGGAELFIDEITRDLRLPYSVKDLIFALYNGDATRARAIVECADLNRPELPPVVKTGNAGFSEISAVIKGMTDYILSKMNTRRNDRLWPADYRVFSTNPVNVAYGAMGTALFLKTVLGELPPDAEQWLEQQDLSPEIYPPGLFVGLSGIAWGLEELGFTAKARAAMEAAYRSPLLFESPDIFYGTAGVGLASLYFFTKTGDRRFLDKGREFGDSMIARASSSEKGCYWTNLDGIDYFGHCHGGSGLALFLLNLYQATGDCTYLGYAIDGLEYEIAHARIDHDTAAWDRAKGDSMELPYWRFGSGGIGSTLIRFFSVLGEERYRALAEKVANRATTKYAVFPGQFAGLSGIGEFLIDMFHFTGEQRYLDDAFRVAQGVLLFQIRRPEGIAFPGEELLRISTDYGTGSAGIGMFLQRLLEPSGRLFFEFDFKTSPLLEVNAAGERI